MMLELKNVKRYDALSDTRLLVFMDCEDFFEALDQRSPNLLIQYLNSRYGLAIEPVEKGKKGGGYGTV
ncbi:MAG: hypothetical protein ACTTKI_00440 [Tannerella sp.]|uniref:hypothetical protein n=1 Tax=Tannerella sp. TaxID=2382127 RepID=UPI003FA30977